MDKITGTTTTSIIQTLKPRNAAWREMPPPNLPEAIAIRKWYHPELLFQAISAVEYIEEGEKAGPEYHLSFSKFNSNGGVKRVTTNEANWLLDQFGLEGAFEDNHVPGGVVRNFWRTVREDLVGLECACTDTENTIKEDKGDYVWRTSK